jgi:hypothetical protein
MTEVVNEIQEIEAQIDALYAKKRLLECKGDVLKIIQAFKLGLIDELNWSFFNSIGELSSNDENSKLLKFLEVEGHCNFEIPNTFKFHISSNYTSITLFSNHAENTWRNFLRDNELSDSFLVKALTDRIRKYEQQKTELDEEILTAKKRIELWTN